MERSSIAQFIGILPDYLTIPVLYIVRYYFYKNLLEFKTKTIWLVSTSLFLISFNFLTILLSLNTLSLIFKLLLFLSIFFLCKGNFIIKIYAIIVEETILLLFNLSLLPFNFWIDPIINNITMSFNQHMIINFLRGIALSILSYAILYIVLNKICSLLKLRAKYLNLYQSLYLLTPCASVYGLALIFYLIQEIKIDDKIYTLPYIAPRIYYIVLPFISILLLISIPIMVYTFKNMLESYEQKQKIMLIEQQFKIQLNHMKNIDVIYLQIRKVFHDMNNHISCLRNLADNNNLEEIKKYLHNISETVGVLDFKIKTGNPICDAIINEKYNISVAEGIGFICDFMLPPKISLEYIDLCVILSNALDNSIEACKRITDLEGIEKKISIKSYLRGLYLIIEISNSSTEYLRYSGDKILSSKPDPINHGIGLSNINDVVKKYNGIVDIIEEKNCFTLSIMLKIN